MSTDSSTVKQIKTDISRKNELRSELEKSVILIGQWKDKLAKSNSFQKQKQYSASIKRYITKVEQMCAILRKMNEDLDKRIREAENFSDTEIKRFQLQLEEELNNIGSDEGPKQKTYTRKKTIVKAKVLKKPRKSRRVSIQRQRIDKAVIYVAGNLEVAEKATGKIIKLKNSLGEIGKEIVPEKGSPGSSDKVLFTQELKRIARENAIYGAQSAGQ